MATAVKELNIIICGTGGQGVVLMSELLGNAAVSDGLKVMGSEVLGMAQRGGSVFSNIRLGDGVYAPLTPDGKCDVLVAVEPSEALRNIQYLNANSLVILNTRKVIPTTVSLGQSTYPEMEQVTARLSQAAGRLITLDAVEIAEKAGNRLATNVVMLGALFGTGIMPINTETIKNLVAERVPPKALKANMAAFDLGYGVSSKIKKNSG